jgi:hypothetical protein
MFLYYMMHSFQKRPKPKGKMPKSYYWFNKANFRYYKIFIQRDMFGDIILTLMWGSTYARRGNFKHVAVCSQAEIDSLIASVMKRRLKRGYELI